MKKKINYLFIPIMVLSILSCSDKSKEQPTPKYYSEFGYFDANINGDSINLKNKPDCYEDEKVVRWLSAESDSEGFSSYYFQIYLNKNDTIEIDLSPKSVGLQCAQYPQTYLHIDDNSGKTVCGSMVTIKKNGRLYFPIKDQCKIQVDSIFCFKDPVLEKGEFIVGRINGILYNEKDLKDSIIIRNAHFGVH